MLACAWWAAGFTAFWAARLAPWIPLSSLGAMAPWPVSGHPPSPVLFLGGVLVFAAAAAVSLAAGRTAGRLVARFFRTGRAGGATGIALGWIAVGLLGLGLGIAGLWFRWILLALVAVLALPALRFARSALAGLPGTIRGLAPSGWFMAGLGAVAGWCVLLMSLAPETFEDPLRYHLFLPEQFLRAHRACFMPDFFFWSYFGPVHVLYGIAQAAGGRTAAQGVNIATGLLAAVLLWRICVSAGLAHRDRSLVLALVVSGPGFLLISGSTFVEHGQALYVLAALERILDVRGPWGHRLRAAALLAGQGFAVKYTAALGIMGMAAAATALPAGRAGMLAAARALVRNPGPVLLAAGAFAPWGAWRWWETGDPVSPVLAGLGVKTMDSASRGALREYYGFTRDSWATWLGSPDKFLEYPLAFAGAHPSFWECPGPAIPAMIPAAWVALRHLSGVPRALVLFCLVSGGAWMVLFGGASPHYIVGIAGTWTAAMVVALAAMPGPVSGRLRPVMWAAALVQSVAGVAGVGLHWEPRDVSFGAETKAAYLERVLKPSRVAWPIREWLDERPGVGGSRVLVYGDNHGSYIDARVHLDIERTPRPLLWKLAEESRTPEGLRRRLRQRGIEWMLYSLHWPVLLARERGVARPVFRIRRRPLYLLQDFWRQYAEPVVGAYPPVGRPSSPTWAVRFRTKPARGPLSVDRWREPEVLPGTLGWFWPAMARERAKNVDDAITAYRRVTARYPDYALARLQLARILSDHGRKAEAARERAAAARIGWRFGDSRGGAGPTGGE